MVYLVLGSLTVGCMHDVVQIVYSKTAVLSCFPCDSSEEVVAFTAWFVSTFSGEEASYRDVRS